LGIAGAGATEFGLEEPSAPEALRQLSAVVRTTTHRTSAVEHFMLRGKNVLASTVDASVPKGILVVFTV